MSVTSNPGQNPYGSPTPPNNDSKKNLLTIAGIAIALLLGTNIFLLVNKYKTGQQLTQTQTELDTKESVLADLQKTYDTTIAELDAKKGENTELNNVIEAQKAELSASKDRIAKLAGDNKRLSAAREELGRLKGSVDGYLAKIAELEKDKEALTAANNVLTAEKTSLTADVEMKKTEIGDLSTAKAALTSEKETLTKTNSFLSKKVDIASVIKVDNITVKSVKVTDSGKEKTKKRAKNVERLKVCFNASANKVAEKGTETFYVVVLDPTGTVLAIESLGSGVGTDKENEKEFKYTTSAQVDYSNAAQDICAAWEPSVDFMKGEYKVEVYNKGYLCGSSVFKLK